MVSSSCNDDIKHGFDLFEILVKCPAQVGEALIIDRRK
jgi:hypothetical protein